VSNYWFFMWLAIREAFKTANFRTMSPPK
jgi:hypothetical protein